MANARSHTKSNSTASSLMQEIQGLSPTITTTASDDGDKPAPGHGLLQAVHARRAQFVRPKQIRIKIGSWNVAGHKGVEKDIAGWFVEGKGLTPALAGLRVNDPHEAHGREVPEGSDLGDREDVESQEARYTKTKSTLPKDDPGSLPGDDEIGLYVLGLQEVVEIGSITEALRPYTDPSVAARWKQSVSDGLPSGYVAVAEQQLIGLLLLIFASPDIAKEISSVSTTSVGTGLGGVMGNKGAVTARIVLGETTRLVFVNCHLAAGTDKTLLERRNWDAAQIVARTRFEPIRNTMDIHQNTGEQIGDEDFAFWFGDLNYRLEGIPGDDVRRLLMLHTRNQYDLSQESSRKIEDELRQATEAIEERRINEPQDTEIFDEIDASEDPTSLQTTLSSLLPHDELHQQMKARKAFHDGWREGSIRFLPTYKYDPGSVGIFDSTEKRRAPSWCDRILYRTRRDRLGYLSNLKKEEAAKQKDAQIQQDEIDRVYEDDSILYDYDPEHDGDDQDNSFDPHDESADGTVITKEGFEDEIHLEYYTAHQRVLSSDHKPLNAIFSLNYERVIPELKAKVYAEVAKDLDKTENETRPSVTVVVDKHRDDETAHSDSDAASFEGIWFGKVRWGQAKHRTLTIANTGRVPATFTFIARPVGSTEAAGIASSWFNIKINETPIPSSSLSTDPICLEPGDTAVVEIELRLFDVRMAHDLNEGKKALDDIMVLRVDDGRDHFIPIRAQWLNTSLGYSIDKLTRIPEGGIRKLQNQRPSDKGISKSSSRSDSKGVSTAPTETSASDELPVRFSAPRELFKLTAAVEDLAIQTIAEWSMVHPPSNGNIGPHGDTDTPDVAVPWIDNNGWPFEESCWTERTSSTHQDALSAVMDILDTDGSLDGSWQVELPRVQRLYVLANALLLLLQHMPDGVIPNALWDKVDIHLRQKEKSKQGIPEDDERMAIQEILATQPSSNVCFILITSMLERILREIEGSDISATRQEEVSSPTRRAGGALLRIATLGRQSADVSQPRTGNSREAMIRIFAKALIRAHAPATEKAKSALERREQDFLGLFIST